jgi:ECL1/2/3 zinc binding proteins
VPFVRTRTKNITLYLSISPLHIDPLANSQLKMATAWSLDFCLVCDQQISGGGAYCSQSCRLADLDQHASDSVSSYAASLSSKSTMQPKANLTRPSIRTGSSSSSSSSSSSHEHSSSLTSTSSQTSLSSLTSTLSPSGTLSNQVRHELQDYTKCFDPVRDWKRRLTNS